MQAGTVGREVRQHRPDVEWIGRHFFSDFHDPARLAGDGGGDSYFLGGAGGGDSSIGCVTNSGGGFGGGGGSFNADTSAPAVNEISTGTGDGEITIIW